MTGAAASVLSPPLSATKPRDIYDDDKEYLLSLSLMEVQDRMDELDSQFRRDMALLTEKYDAARQALETVVGIKSSS